MALTGGAVDDVWDELLAGHLAAGTTGRALSDAGGSIVASLAIKIDEIWKLLGLDPDNVLSISKTQIVVDGVTLDITAIGDKLYTTREP